MPARILIVDDHSPTRDYIHVLFAGQPVEICGEAENGMEAIDKVRHLQPDLVILDLTMPKMDGFVTAYEIRRIAPQTKIVVFSVHEVPKSPAATRILAADAFVSKTDATQLLQQVKRLLHLEDLDSG